MNGSNLNNITCYNKNDIDNLKENLYYYSITFINDNLNLDNYSSHFSNSLNNVTYKYNEEIFIINYLFFHNIELKTITVFLFDFVNEKGTISYDYSAYISISGEESESENQSSSEENSEQEREEEEEKKMMMIEEDN